jgi:hypothetical protein
VPGDSDVYHLLQLEDVVIELLLQRFVGEVDTQLLERVVLKRLEPEDIQYACMYSPQPRLASPQARIHAGKRVPRARVAHR